MSNLKRVVHCGIDFNLMESGDREYREKCLQHWLENNCTGNYNYEWSSPDELTISFDVSDDYKKSATLVTDGIPHAT